jgi:hypothetical protein
LALLLSARDVTTSGTLAPLMTPHESGLAEEIKDLTEIPARYRCQQNNRIAFQSLKIDL